MNKSIDSIFEEEEAIKLAFDYQIYFRKKLENIG
jgi:hypothetical protein